MLKLVLRKIRLRSSCILRSRKMLNARDAAFYLLSLDKESQYFNNDLFTYNSITSYIGNTRLNKILHLAQNIYIGRTGKLLIDTDFYAYNNGGVIPDIQENYMMLLGIKEKVTVSIPQEEASFLKKVFIMLKDTPINELIEIDHEDPAWIEKHVFYKKSDQKMNSLKFKSDYKERYEAANFYLDRIIFA